jgi:hypothetical protein
LIVYGEYSNNLLKMNKEELLHIAKNIESELKDFQKATVNYVFDKLYKKGERKHLVADEVGLGKTIVAKGVIAKAMEAHLKKESNEPFRVIYICSNQALSGQNLKKLNIFKKDEFVQNTASRLIYMALKPQNNERFQLSSLTPSTSFRIISGTGVAEERMLIWTILSKYADYNKGRRNNGLKLALLGTSGAEGWREKLDKYKCDKGKNIRKDIYPKFRDAVASSKINLEAPYYYDIKKELNISGTYTLKYILIRYAEMLRVDTVEKYKGQKKLLGTIRKLLTDIVLDYLEADLFILDEFQRFKDLIDTEGEDLSEASYIAQKVFNSNDAKVLMLSATPFKPFTTKLDEQNGEDHHAEFKKVLAFLLNHNKRELNKYDKNSKAFFDYLRRPELLDEINELPEKEELELLYRKVLSRTERLLVSDDKNTLLKNTKIDYKLGKEDIQNFIDTDKVVNELNKSALKGNHNLIDFSKSIPYPLSFMDNYVFKDHLKKAIKQKGPVLKMVQEVKDAWIDLDKIQQYKPLDTIPNGNMRTLIDIGLKENKMYLHLWLKPAIPYYKTHGCYKDAVNPSKVLIFSKWRMVPKSIAAIVSYEAERVTIGSRRLHFKDLKYTPEYSSTDKIKRLPRKPGKVLSLKVKNDNPATMSVFTHLYPSLTLANCYQPDSNIRVETPHSLSEINKHIVELLKEKVKKAAIDKYNNKGKVSLDWYWLMPLLLDKFYFKNEYNDWFSQSNYLNSDFIANKNISENMEENNDEKAEKTQNKSANLHMEELKKNYENFGSDILSVGAFPDDLFEVMASQVLASPAVCGLRILNQYFDNTPCYDRLNRSIDIATEFHALFDKPESIAIVKLAAKSSKKKTGQRFFWKNVLDYCVEGNLQSTLDEFAHLIKPETDSMPEFTDRIKTSVNINTTSLKVDNSNSFIKGETVNMRSHYAVDFGNQDMEKEEGRNRVKGVLANFNSPFRPFVLASTSIGQEGLDFHYYCRKVMHWNLPSNPIDIEQREGRVNRFKGLVIRQNLVQKYFNLIDKIDGDIWSKLFELARKVEGRGMNKPELVPFWHVESDDIHIERIIPLIPFSREVGKLEQIISTLALYRLTFGQPRQEELIEALNNRYGEEIIDLVRKKLMINLSPINY